MKTKKTIEEIEIKNLLPNPFRRIEEYKIPEGKIEALIRSFKTSGVWPTVIGRRVGGKVEKAFGHARTEAAKRLYGPTHKIDVVIMDISDEEMLRMMADENGELWGTDFLVDMETVHAVIDAYGNGTIRLESPKEKAPVLRDARREHPYTALTVSRFLGWITPKGDSQARVDAAIRALGLIQDGALSVEDFAGLGHKAAEALIKQTARIKSPEQSKLTEPKEIKKRQELRVKVAKEVSKALKTGTGYRHAYKVADKIAYESGYKQPLPEADTAIPQLCNSISSFLSEHDDKERRQKVQDVIDAKKVLDADLVEQVAAALSVVIDRCQILARQLKPSTSTKRANNATALLKQ